MRSPPMRGALLVVASITVAAAAALVAAGPARADSQFTDPAGDGGAAHDVTTLDVSHDTTQVVWRFPVPSPWPELRQAEDQAWLLSIDVDRNPSTGDGGDEVRVFQRQGASVFVWNGSDWVDAPPDGISVRFELSSTSADWRVQLPRRLLGNATGFDFTLMFAKFTGDSVSATDLAPDRGVWRYELAAQRETTAAKATIGAVRLVPARPVAGKPLTLRVSVTSSATGQPLTTGAATCSAKVQGRLVRGSASISNGIATCRLVVPKRSTGSVGRGSITIGSGALAATRPFSFRIA